jgi:hypothetical protein
MPATTDLEMSLHRLEGGAYSVEFRLRLPDSEADSQPGRGQATFNLEALRRAGPDSAAYGGQLTGSLFADPEVKAALAAARAAAEAQESPLRLRLLIGPSAPELHGLHWETLRDPQDGSPLFTGERLLFSRYLTSPDARPVRLRPKGGLLALAAIASPADLAAYDLAAVDVAGELEGIRAGLGAIPVTVLASGQEPPTLNNLAEILRREEPDILYLVCHGLALSGETWLFLEGEDGKTARTAGTDLVNRLKELSQRPRLVVLASCQTASPAGEGVLSALGPRLAEAGIPAVIAMQGKVSLGTLSDFMPVFFAELQRDGQIDRAAAVARGAVRDRPDAWMPALFMRLRNGRIWYVPGFKGPDAFKKWPALLSNIEAGACTPILGPGLSDSLLGSQREIAQRWAESFAFPLFPHERESLPQVAQFLAVEQDETFPRNELTRYLRGEIQRRYAQALPPEKLKPNARLDDLILAIHAWRAQQGCCAPYDVLASLPLPVFITVNVHNLLKTSLQKAGKDPQVVISPWNETVLEIETVYQTEPDYEPTPERPLVYHLFGHLGEPDSVVLTEDDYFKYLIGVTKNNRLVPSSVRLALANTALLFLGFQLDDWNFRVLFQSLLSQGGSAARRRYAHIAGQVEPEEGRFLDSESARRYLENYFGGANISLYWGSPEDFVQELAQKMAVTAGAA